jgi:hypothetical protein
VWKCAYWEKASPVGSLSPLFSLSLPIHSKMHYPCSLEFEVVHDTLSPAPLANSPTHDPIPSQRQSLFTIGFTQAPETTNRKYRYYYQITVIAWTALD